MSGGSLSGVSDWVAKATWVSRVLGVDVTQTAGDTAQRTRGQGGDRSQPSGELVAKRKFLLERWKQIPAEVSVEVSGLEGRVAERLPHEDAAGFCASLDAWFGRLLSEFQTELDDAIISSINSGDAAYGQVAGVLRSFRARIDNDKLVAYMRGSDLLQGDGFASAFTRAFDEIDTALTR
jgi:hypothetical protein